MEVADAARRLDRKIGVEQVDRRRELGQPADDARRERPPADRHALARQLCRKLLETEIADVHGGAGSASPSSSKRAQTPATRSLSMRSSSSNLVAKNRARSEVVAGEASIRRNTAAEN